jgi:DME family drug/metabolite transporter
MILTRSHFFVLLAALGLSFILIFSTALKNTGISSLEQVFGRVFLALIFVSLIFRKEISFARKKDIFFFSKIGFVFSTFLFAALSAIAIGTPVVVVVALIYTQPAFTAILAWMMKKERINKFKIFIICLSILGAFLVSGLTLKEVIAMQINPGVLLALTAGFCYALYLYLKRSVTGYKPMGTLFNTFLFALPAVFVLGFFIKVFFPNPLFTSLVVPNLWQFALLLGFALFSTVLPYGSLNYVKPREIAPTTEGLLLLLDPVLHSLWAFLIFNQVVSPVQYLGAALIIIAAAVNLKTK